jgi:hypothetical protein
MGGKVKGSKAKKTIIKEAVGLDSWENLQRFLLNEGADKFIEEVSKMKGHAFAINFLQAIEYFKPKLSRVDSQNSHKVEIKNFIVELSNEADGKITE